MLYQSIFCRLKGHDLKYDIGYPPDEYDYCRRCKQKFNERPMVRSCSACGKIKQIVGKTDGVIVISGNPPPEIAPYWNDTLCYYIPPGYPKYYCNDCRGEG